MSNIISKIFIENEKIIITSIESGSTIQFEDKKQLYLYLDSSRNLFDCFYSCVQEWISRIEYNKELYTLEALEPIGYSHGGVSIKYNDIVIANLYLDRSVISNPDGSKGLSACIHLKFIRESDRILGKNQQETLHINDRTFETTQEVEGKILSLIETLDHLIPTRSEAIVQAISHVFQVNSADIILDSFKKRYIINTPYIFKDTVKPVHPTRFYKYVSMKTYSNMLRTQSFRMNSIICQSDETETLYFGNFLCEEFISEVDRYPSYLNEKNTLISCFTDVPDDPFMWKNYGDKGEGVMLGFESLSGDILSPIQYIDEKSVKLNAIKENVKIFKEEKISLYFSEIIDMHRFIKNDKYKSEKEWRLIHEYCGKLDDVVYDNPEGRTTYAKYHDFAFTNNILPELGMILVSVTFGPNQRESNIPLLAEDTVKKFGEIHIHRSKLV